MEAFPYVPHSIIWEMLPARDLAALVRTCRSIHMFAESFLYRLNAVTPGHSAVMWVVEAAPPGVPQMQAAALGTLDKVRRFCRLAPDALLDPCYSTRQARDIDYYYSGPLNHLRVFDD